MPMHIDKIISGDGTLIDTNNISNSYIRLSALPDVSFGSVKDGDTLVYNAALGKWSNSGYQANSLQSYYGTSEGIHLVNWGPDTESTVRPMYISFYGGKAWVELMFSQTSSPTAPWDYWINPLNNALKSYNVTDSSGLNYDSGEASVLVAPQIMTNLLITSKDSVLSGINPNLAVDCSHMSSVNRNQFMDYFTGVIAGFEQLDTFGMAGGIGNYDTHLGYRNGTIQDDEWMIADSVEGGSVGAPLWGYRRTGQHKGGNVRGLSINENRVFSVWGTNY
tara:strand:- start:454 stop:1284 length:831 start_codon:yes stop_codon:yes gene_type:complete